MTTVPERVLEVRRRVLAGEDVYGHGTYGYCGDLEPVEIGDVLFDPEEGEWVIRILEEDEDYGCGVECCGIRRYALVSVIL